MEFVTTNPRISKPRVRGSNPLGRANNLSIFKISLNLSPYMVMSWSCLIPLNPILFEKIITIDYNQFIGTVY